MIAAEQGNEDIVRVLLDLGKKLNVNNYKKYLEITGFEKLTATDLAIINGHEHLFTHYLFDDNTDISPHSIKLAIKHNQFDIARHLLGLSDRVFGSLMREIVNNITLPHNRNYLNLAEAQPSSPQRDYFINYLEKLGLKKNTGPQPFARLLPENCSNEEIQEFVQKIQEAKNQKGSLKIVLGDPGRDRFVKNPYFDGCIFVDPDCPRDSNFETGNYYTARFGDSTIAFYSLIKCNKELLKALQGNVDLIWEDWGTFFKPFSAAPVIEAIAQIPTDFFKEQFNFYKALLSQNGKMIMTTEAYLDLIDNEILSPESIQTIQVCNQKIGLENYLKENLDKTPEEAGWTEIDPKNLAENRDKYMYSMTVEEHNKTGKIYHSQCWGHSDDDRPHQMVCITFNTNQ